MNLTKALFIGIFILLFITTAASSNIYTLDFEDKSRLPNHIESHIVESNGDQKLRIENEKLSINLSNNFSNWTSISYTINGRARGNVEMFISGINGHGRNDSFKSYIGTRPWMRFMSAQEGHRGYKTYADTDFNVRPDKEYRVVLNRTGAWRADISVFTENGGEILPRSGNHIEDRYIFHIFDDIGGGFSPQQFVFKSNKPGEVGLFDDIIIRHDGQRNISPAPEPSAIIVHPSWEPVIMASVVDRPVIVRDSVDTYVENRIEEIDPERIYTVGEVTARSLNVTSIQPRHIPDVFFPEAEQAVLLKDNREQQIRAAAYAQRNNMPLVTQQQDRDIIDRSADEFADHTLNTSTGINHLVLASTDAPSSALAGRYAAENNAYVQPASGSVVNHRKAVEQGIFRLADHNMGVNTTISMLEGTYLTLFGAPYATKQDPIEATTFIGADPKDGTSFPSDRLYADLSGDGRLDVNPGRMPRDVEAVSAMMAESERSEDAVVAASYRHKTWLQTLLHHGGGMWTGNRLASILENRGINTTLLVENRTAIRDIDRSIRGLLFRLVGTSDPRNVTKAREIVKQDLDEGNIDDALQTIALHADLFTKDLASNAIVDDNSSTASHLNTLATVFSGVLAVREVTKLLEAYLEYETDIDHDKLAEIASRLDTYNSTGSLAQDVIAALLDPHPSLNASQLDASLPNASKVIYTGVGNGSHWVLPNEGGLNFGGDGLFNQYNGSRLYKPTVDGFLYDMSTEAAASSLSSHVLRHGADGLAGHSAKTYGRYVAPLARHYVQNGFTRGQAARRAVNNVQSQWVFDPDHLLFVNAYWRHKARMEKTTASFIQYGNPEAVKDPVVPERKNLNRDCEGTACTYVWTPTMEKETVDGRPVVAGLPSTSVGNISVPYYRLERTLPQGSVVESVETTTGKIEQYDADPPVVNQLPAQPVQYDTYKLPDGRIKLVVRRAAIVYREEGIDVHQDPSVTVQANQPVHADVNVQTGSDKVAASVDGVEGTVMMELRNTTWRDRQQQKEDQAVVWKDVKPGKYLLRATVDGEVRVGPVEKTITVDRKEPKIDVAAPDVVDRTEHFEITVEAHNPTRKRQEITVGIVPEDGIQSAAFHPGNTSFVLEPGEHRQETLTLQAFLSGEHEITLSALGANISRTITVHEKEPVEKFINAVKQYLLFNSPSEQFEITQQSNRRTIFLKQFENTIRIQETPDFTVANLTMMRQSLDLKKQSGMISKRYTAPKGEASVRKENGRIVRKSRDLPGSIQESLDAMMERELRKIKRRYYWEKRSTTR